MANANVGGFKPVRHLNGSPYNQQTNRYYIPASDSNNYFVGDMVKLAGGGAADSNGVPAVTIAQGSTSDTSLLGAIVSIEPQASRPNDIYRPASVLYYVNVCDQWDVVYEVHEDGNMGVGVLGNTPFVEINVSTAGSTLTGQSGQQLVSSSANASSASGHSLEVRRLVQKPNNVAGTNAAWEVTIANYAYKV